MTRTKRQIEVLKKWRENNFRGIFQAATGFGKTYTAIMAIQGMVTKADIKSCLVVVPTIIVFNGKEVERFQANIMMQLEATRKQVQSVIDEVIYSDF